MGNCNKCGTQNRDGAKYCRNCGNPLEQKQKTRGGFGIPILAVLGILLAFGVIYALKGGFGDSSNSDVSKLYEDTTAVGDNENNKLPAPVQKLLEDMVYVEGGSFMMLVEKPKSDDDEWDPSGRLKYIEKRTSVSSFYICKYEVTQELWMSVMGNNPSHWSKEFGYPDDLQRPVESVGLKDCQIFIEKLNDLTGKRFRLPSCAEWQYAAKGGKKSKGYKYAGSNNLDEVAWFPIYEEMRNSEVPVHPVGMKKGNELKLYDMNGNVSEITSDRISGPDCIIYYVCGGAFNDDPEGGPDGFRSYFKVNYFDKRYSDELDRGSWVEGIRLAMSADD